MSYKGAILQGFSCSELDEQRVRAEDVLNGSNLFYFFQKWQLLHIGIENI